MVETRIDLAGIEVPPSSTWFSGENREKMAAVLFRVTDGKTNFVFPIVVDRRETADDDFVVHAKRVAVQLLEDLAALASPWHRLPAPRNWAAEPFGSRPEDRQTVDS